MPYEVIQNHPDCDEPFAVVKSADGSLIGCHPTAGSAGAQIKAIEMKEQNSTYIIDPFVSVKPGEPFRLFPFGKFVKNGKVREITRELASKFRLPHFRPPIKLGSHDDPTPAGGHLTGLEVREDGLYGLPEWNDEGTKAVNQGSYRYHSPEVIWEGGFEDPVTGELIEGPLIVGDALLHTPHLGEATAFYSAETQIVTEDKTMANEEVVSVPASLWEKMTAVFDREPEPEPAEQPDPEVTVEEFEAKVKEAEEYKAKLEALEAEGRMKARVEELAAEFEEIDALKEDAELFEKLAGLSEEDAAFVIQRLKAVGAQVEESLTEETGSDGEAVDDNPKLAYHAEIERVSKEQEVDYATAMQIVNDTNPALFEAYKNG